MLKKKKRNENMWIPSIIFPLGQFLQDLTEHWSQSHQTLGKKKNTPWFGRQPIPAPQTEAFVKLGR